MESSLKDEIKAGGSLLNHAKDEPLSVIANALHLTDLGVHAAPSDFSRC